MLTLGAAPAKAADGNGVCNLPGSGTVGAPWEIDSQADLLEIGIGDCISTYNSAHHYILTGDIALTGNWTPIELRSNIATSFDGDGFTISGLSVVGSSDYRGMFSTVSGGTVKDLYLRGTSVSGGGFVGSLAGVVQGSTIQNVHVELSGGVAGTGQQVGGLIGTSSNSVLENLSIIAGGNISGSDYSGGGVGKVEGSGSVSHIAVRASTNFSGISGGVIGYLVPDSNRDLQGLYYQGDMKGNQFVGGLVGYVFSAGSYTINVGNSAVRGSVAASGNSDPAVLIGNVGNGISAVSTSRSYSTAIFLKNNTASVSAVRLHLGNSAMTATSFAYEPSSGTSITLDGTLTTGITSLATITDPAAVPLSTWVIATQTGRSPSVTGTWVIDTSGNLNQGRPMLVRAYLEDFYGEILSDCVPGEFKLRYSGSCLDAPAGSFVAASGSRIALPCSVGTFSAAAASTSCTPTPAGKFTAVTGSTAPVDCPAGTFQPAQNSLDCIPASIGSFVANAGSDSETACAAGTTTLTTGQTACVAITSSGYSGPLINSSTVAAPGAKVTISGSGLSGVTTVKIDGVVCVVNSVSGSSITITLPTALTSGAKDLVLLSDSGSLTVQGAIKVTGSAVSATQQTASLKRVGDRVRFMVKDVVGAGKIQFKINGKEVAWVRAVDATDPKLRKTSSNESYFVRTSSLVRGKNAVEIFVDGERVKRASYSR
jgi:hypothetical protein